MKFFDKMDGFIRIYDGTRYLTLFGSEKYDAIYVKIRYLIIPKSCITYIFCLKVDSYASLPIEERVTLHNVIIIFKSFLNNDKNHYYYKIFLEKWSYHMAKK